MATMLLTAHSARLTALRGPKPGQRTKESLEARLARLERDRVVIFNAFADLIETTGELARECGRLKTGLRNLSTCVSQSNGLAELTPELLRELTGYDPRGETYD